MPKNPTAFLDLQRHLDGPPWRWMLAQREAAQPSTGPLGQGDKLVAQAADCLRLCRQEDFDRHRARKRYPAILAAHALWENEVARDQLKVLAMGGCPHCEVGTQLGVVEEIIATAEALYFDIRPSFNATGWIAYAVIRPEERAGNLDLAVRLRAAYFGGGLVAQAIVDAAQRLPMVKADRLFDQSVQMHLKVEQAIAMPLRDGRDALKLIQLHLEHSLQEKKLDLEIEKFRYACSQELARRQTAENLAPVVDPASESPQAKKEGLKVA